MIRTTTLAATLTLLAQPAAAQMQGYPGYYDDHMMWGGGWHGWFLGPLMMVFWLAVIVGAVVLVLRLLGVTGPGCGTRPKSGPDAMDILRERFARGEIDKAEFEERRALLER